MKIYGVILSDYDLFGEYGYYLHKIDAEKKLAELLKTPNKILENWKKYLRIEEKEVIE